MCVGEQLYPPGVVRLERVTVGQEPKDRAAATVRYLSHREAWAHAANLADDVYEGMFKRWTSNQQLQVRR